MKLFFRLARNGLHRTRTAQSVLALVKDNQYALRKHAQRSRAQATTTSRTNERAPVVPSVVRAMSLCFVLVFGFVTTDGPRSI